MALKPTIYKFNMTVADIDQSHYDSFNLTVARHPSETTERMMARILAYCMNAQEAVSFTKGLSTSEEPDIWSHTPDNRISLWIEVGEPSFDRIKKATRIASTVKVYSFNTKSGSWWADEANRFEALRVSVVRLDWNGIQALAQGVQRTMSLSLTLSDGIIYASSENGEWEIPWQVLKR